MPRLNTTFPAYGSYRLSGQYIDVFLSSFPGFSMQPAFTPQQARDGKQPGPDWRDAIWGKDQSIGLGDVESETRAQIDRFLSRRARKRKPILG